MMAAATKPNPSEKEERVWAALERPPACSISLLGEEELPATKDLRSANLIYLRANSRNVSTLVAADF